MILCHLHSLGSAPALLFSSDSLLPSVKLSQFLGKFLSAQDVRPAIINWVLASSRKLSLRCLSKVNRAIYLHRLKTPSWILEALLAPRPSAPSGKANPLNL